MRRAPASSLPLPLLLTDSDSGVPLREESAAGDRTAAAHLNRRSRTRVAEGCVSNTHGASHRCRRTASFASRRCLPATDQLEASGVRLVGGGAHNQLARSVRVDKVAAATHRADGSKHASARGNTQQRQTVVHSGELRQPLPAAQR